MEVKENKDEISTSALCNSVTEECVQRPYFGYVAPFLEKLYGLELTLHYRWHLTQAIVRM
jgi:hypothetical protein